MQYRENLICQSYHCFIQKLPRVSLMVSCTFPGFLVFIHWSAIFYDVYYLRWGKKCKIEETNKMIGHCNNIGHMAPLGLSGERYIFHWGTIFSKDSNTSRLHRRPKDELMLPSLQEETSCPTLYSGCTDRNTPIRNKISLRIRAPCGLIFQLYSWRLHSPLPPHTSHVLSAELVLRLSSGDPGSHTLPLPTQPRSAPRHPNLASPQRYWKVVDANLTQSTVPKNSRWIWGTLKTEWDSDRRLGIHILTVNFCLENITDLHKFHLKISFT